VIRFAEGSKMYQFSYADILADGADSARAREHQLLDQAVALLTHAAESDPRSPAVTRALDFTTELWAVFIKDLAHPGNAMPDQLKADLMSIGLGIMGECSRIMSGKSHDFAAVAEICGIVRDGLN
jgi:flagellar biosynthesis activator protein FlaF